MASVSGTGRLDTERADEIIDHMAKKYLGVDTYPFLTGPYRQPDERINVRVAPQNVIYSPGG